MHSTSRGNLLALFAPLALIVPAHADEVEPQSAPPAALSPSDEATPAEVEPLASAAGAPIAEPGPLRPLEPIDESKPLSAYFMSTDIEALTRVAESRYVAVAKKVAEARFARSRAELHDWQAHDVALERCEVVAKALYAERRRQFLADIERHPNRSTELAAAFDKLRRDSETLLVKAKAQREVAAGEIARIQQVLPLGPAIEYSAGLPSVPAAPHSALGGPHSVPRPALSRDQEREIIERARAEEDQTGTPKGTPKEETP